MLDRKKEGQGLIEYALIVLLIAIVVIVVLSLIGGEVNGVFENILNGLTPSGN
jgi:pilus assembly protein Flp/PilA